MHLRPDDGDDVEEDQVIVVAYQTDRLVRVGAKLEAVSELVRFLHVSSDEGRNARPPRCGHCDTPWDVPPLDEEVECASA